jgi:hypothetical protein
MNPTLQRLARERQRIEDETPDPDALATLAQRVIDLERRLGLLDLRLADALAAERDGLRQQLDQLRADLTAAGVAIPPPATKRTPKRTAPNKRTDP